MRDPVDLKALRALFTGDLRSLNDAWAAINAKSLFGALPVLLDCAEWVRDLGLHHNDCERSTLMGDNPCTCGLDALRAQLAGGGAE